MKKTLLFGLLLLGVTACVAGGCASSKLPVSGAYRSRDIGRKNPIEPVAFEDGVLGIAYIQGVTINPADRDNSLEYDAEKVEAAANKYVRSVIGESGLLRITQNEERATLAVIADVTQITWRSGTQDDTGLIDIFDDTKYDEENHRKGSWIEINMELTFLEIRTGDFIASASAVGVLCREDGESVQRIEISGGGIGRGGSKYIMTPVDGTDVPTAVQLALVGSTELCRSQLLRHFGQDVASAPTGD
ncbi:MAG: hypothetical protein H6814_09080 [Phycisphaeraceae bacterium]|nr:hypothetical protein [Phycisphaeraceae bacterium]